MEEKVGFLFSYFRSPLQMSNSAAFPRKPKDLLKDLQNTSKTY